MTDTELWMWSNFTRKLLGDTIEKWLKNKYSTRHLIHFYTTHVNYLPPGKKVVVTFAVVDEDWDE